MDNSPSQYTFRVMMLFCGLALALYFYVTDFSLPGRTEISRELYYQDHSETQQPINISGYDKVIVLYTRFFKYPMWGFKKPGREAFQKCSQKNCILTNSKKYLRNASVVVFHCRNKFGKMPKWHNPNQIMTMYCAEAALNSPVQKFDHHINMTATYRLDSDLYVPYFHVRDLDTPRSEPYVPKMNFSEKTKSVAWVVSHCRTKAKREAYARELSKHIDVDIYGHCGNRGGCPRQVSKGPDDCFQKIARNYKFYLAFEHSLCRDYVTEKFYRTLTYDIIPIVLGDGEYSSLAPPSSYINVRDFNSPKDLAEFLKSLAANRTAYESYLQWKTRQVVEPHSRPAMFCDLCRIAHDGTFHRPAYKISDWWSKERNCNQDYVPKLLGI